jgi:putative FmdB family regulatory protein
MLYDYQCPKCNHIFDDFKPVAERHTSVCPKCGATANMKFSGTTSRAKIFHPYWDEHMGHDPVWVESASHKKMLLQERGLFENDHWVEGDKLTKRWI